MFAQLADKEQVDPKLQAELHPQEGAQVRVALIGVGAVAAFHHIPGIRLDPRAALTAICDPDANLLEKRKQEWGPVFATTDYKEIMSREDVDAVVIATPNFLHVEIAMAALKAGKHVMCEKPLGLNAEEACQLAEAAKNSNNVHMTAFTYRFAPSMQFLKKMIEEGKLGEIRHFRSQRFLDWDETSWGWRQYKKTAGAGNTYDMMIHRIDFAQYLLGPISSVSGKIKQFVPRNKTPSGADCEPSQVDDWTAIVVDFENGATGVFEGSTLMKGHHNNGFGYEWAEVNGSLGTAVYQLQDPYHILFGTHGGSLEKLAVPEELLVISGSPRVPSEGVPSTVFRYDQMYEFVSAIVEKRPAQPSFIEGASAQVVADAVIQSSDLRRWIDIAPLSSQPTSSPSSSSSSPSSLPLSGKVAVVTGGGTGIGRAVALKFASQGASVFVLGRRLEPLQEVQATHKKSSSAGCVTPFSCDVGDFEAVQSVFAKIVSASGRIDILVNSAGVNIAERHSNVLTFENYRHLMKVNLDGTFNAIHESLPHMKQQKGGLIVNVSSVAALRGLPLAGSAYCASKAAVSGLGSTIASEQWEDNIRVCNFCPGEVNTPIIDQRAVPPSAEARALMLQPEDCADAILMVALLPSRAQVSEMVIKPTVQQFWT
eukprot:TRINITY_DN3013_c0_g3_i1.p1 TRINITY_DN3013_c0_g3~~TRINITY_DN3013_c0_g3_i1.p1  ORF type:complete len:653 (-),score=180.09 TRINITY_DN3013_c0_g3_i1:46-2004(-)